MPVCHTSSIGVEFGPIEFNEILPFYYGDIFLFIFFAMRPAGNILPDASLICENFVPLHSS
jgi:hypothetical protein